jgi:hypothetical protein
MSVTPQHGHSVAFGRLRVSGLLAGGSGGCGMVNLSFVVIASPLPVAYRLSHVPAPVCHMSISRRAARVFDSPGARANLTGAWSSARFRSSPARRHTSSAFSGSENSCHSLR